MIQPLRKEPEPHAADQPIIIQALIGKLEDCKTMILRVTDAHYTLAAPYISSPHKTHSSIGQHTRHIIEFIETLLDQLETGNIDYDSRRRDKTLETDRVAAIAKIEALQEKLLVINSQTLNRPVTAHEAVHSEYDITSTQSTLGREILSVISHTEHHFALIGSQCDALGIVLPDHFGKAISTLRHERSLKK